MNPVRILRERMGLTQQAMASAAGTSQPTIAAYESGARSPPLRTLESLAAALDLEVLTDFVPRMTRVDRRSPAFHSAIAELIQREPERIVSRAKTCRGCVKSIRTRQNCSTDDKAGSNWRRAN